jgi:predicted O-methyltransferase YrrM
MLDNFVALERDKCQLAYLLARSIGAKNVIEAGTSFGVSTIYLALAVGQNVELGGQGHGKVIATEKEPTKASRAKEHWEEAGEEVEK